MFAETICRFMVVNNRQLRESRGVTDATAAKSSSELFALTCSRGFEAWLAAGSQRTRGEFALVLHAVPSEDVAGAPSDALRILRLLLAELPLKTAVKLAAEISGTGRNELYDAALQLKNGVDT